MAMVTRVKATEAGRLRRLPPRKTVERRNAIAAGAFAVHVHPRDAEGCESLAAGDVAAVVDTVPNVGLTTAAWIEPDASERGSSNGREACTLMHKQHER
jgi:uncharacterized protein (DUF849 family)